MSTCLPIVLCLFIIAPGIGGYAREKPRADINIAGIELLATDEGWRVQNAQQMPNGPFQNGDVLLRVGSADVSQLGAISVDALLVYGPLHNLHAVVEREGSQRDVSLSPNSGPDPMDRMRGKYGIGVTLRSYENPHRIVVAYVVPQSPAEKVGLKKDDELIAVDSKPLAELTVSSVADLLTTTHQTPVQLRVRRAVDEFEVTLERSPLVRVFKLPPPGALPFPLHARGDPAPAFSLPGTDGKNTSLDQFRGRPVLLTFWATWCGPCIAEIDVLNKLAHKYRRRLIILGLNVNDEPEDVQRFLQKRPLAYPVLNAGKMNGPTPITYGVTGLPLTLIIGASGSVDYVQSGNAPEGVLEAHVRNAMRRRAGAD